jgi:hypothetical protein
VISREQHYINKLKPEYIILKAAGSRLGTKQSEKTKKLISDSSKARIHSEESKEKNEISSFWSNRYKNIFFLVKLIVQKLKPK